MNFTNNLEARLAIDRAVFADLCRGVPLQDSLTVLCKTLEDQSPGMLCSILVVNHGQNSLSSCAAPSLPESFVEAIQEVPIGPGMGCCGTAAYTKQPVIVSDIANDPLWKARRDVALQHGLRACWSTPITSSEGKVVGTVACYYREPRTPTEREKQLIAWAIPLAEIAIGRGLADDALRDQRMELQTILEAAPVMIWYKDRQNRILRVNRMAAESLGLKKNEVEGRSAYELYPLEASQAHRDDLEVIETGKAKIGVGRRYQSRTGEERWVVTDRYPYRDRNGNVTGVIVFGRDVTEQRKTEIALHDVEIRFQKLVEQVPATIYSAEHGPDGRWSYVSPQIEKLLGYSPEEWMGTARAWVNHLHPGDRERVLAEEAASLREGRSFVCEYRMLRRDGQVVWVRDEATSVRCEIGDIYVWQGVLLDITERKDAELRAQQSNERLSMALEASSLSFWDCDPTTGRIYLSEGWSAALGGEARETHTTSKELLQNVHPDDRERVLAAVKRALKGQISDYREEHRIRNQEGQWVWLASTGKVVERDANGRATRMMGTNLDITEQKRSEEALQQLETVYRTMIERSPIAFYRVTLSGKYLTVNQGMIKMLGYDSEDELYGLTAKTDVWCDPEGPARLLAQYPERVDGEEVTWKRKDGKIITVRLVGHPVRDEDGEIKYCELMAEDVTEKRQLEERLRQAQKMEAVGRLAGGIAHDFNNLLTVVKGQLELLQEHETGSRQVQNIEQAQKAADRAAALTQQLLAFSRMQVLRPRIISLNDVVKEIDKLLPPLTGAETDLKVTLDQNLGLVKADPAQMEQVVLNLAINARDAMPKGGKLTIETANVDLDEAFARGHSPLMAGRYVMLAVSDNGEGMDAETRTRMFEPFFTTKEQGKGTGLGLATVYGIVKQSGGFIWVESEPGCGTTFRIYLPFVRGSVEPETRPEVPARIPTGSETVLLVEDEEGVREVTREFLKLSGYQVLEAENGAAAMEIAEKHGGPIDVLLTDMNMPGLGGLELAKQLTVARPGLKVLFMTGYNEHAVLAEGEVDAGAVLHKPFARETLSLAVRQVLDRRS